MGATAYFTGKYKTLFTSANMSTCASLWLIFLYNTWLLASPADFLTIG